jgi:hypothetical protein
MQLHHAFIAGACEPATWLRIAAATPRQMSAKLVSGGIHAQPGRAAAAGAAGIRAARRAPLGAWQEHLLGAVR